MAYLKADLHQPNPIQSNRKNKHGKMKVKMNGSVRVNVDRVQFKVF